MSISQFEQFKDFLALAVQDPDFVRKNTLLQDSTYLQTVLDRIEATTSDVSIQQDYGDVISTLGLLEVDTANRRISFDPKGFTTTLSGYREATVAEPRRLFRRLTVTDGIYYLLSDGGAGGGNGVFALNDKLEVVKRMANYGANVAGGQYEDPSMAITFTISSIEYVAIADATNHVVQIYLYASPWTHLATIGTVGASGADATHLDSPNGLAVDETNGLLYISCPTGMPAGATASNGFVAVWDVSAPAVPVYSAIPLFYSGTGGLLDAQVYTPVDLFYDGSRLWVSNNGDSTVGAFDVSGAAPVCTRFIETSGAGYTLRGPQQVYILTLAGGFMRLYVANGNTGTVEEFDGVTYQHLATYGIRASEDNLNSYTRMSGDVYGAMAHPQGVVADSVVIDGQTTNVLVVTDDINIRLHRFNLDAYTADNFVNFDEMTWNVPIAIDGWTVSGTVPPDMVTVYYRFAETEQFRVLPPETLLPSTRRAQFRVAVELDTRRFMRDWYIGHLRIHGQQA